MKGLSIAGRKKNDGIDFYTTPSWATEALMSRESFNGIIWECASGNGRMVNVLEKYNKVIATDIRTGVDFLKTTKAVNNIVTNPPYIHAEDFVKWAKFNATEKIAMLLKLTFLESESRYKLFKEKFFPLKKVYVFCKRVNMYREGDIKPINSGTIAFAWYVWDMEYEGLPEIDWIK